VRGILTIPFEYRPLTAQEAVTYGQKNQQETIIASAVAEIPKRIKTPEALAAFTAEKRKPGNADVSSAHLIPPTRYLVYRGVLRNGRSACIIWRETKDWQQADYERDVAFVAEHKLTEGADEIYTNGDSYIPGARSLDGLFKARIFAPVEV